MPWHHVPRVFLTSLYLADKLLDNKNRYATNKNQTNTGHAGIVAVCDADAFNFKNFLYIFKRFVRSHVKIGVLIPYFFLLIKLISRE